ncbi:hypothetical protein F5Y06DRAFT_305745 [Hypoxylon sp. FL0890]|nr:hypothetical protein F5Y06DRAFT_305745 [Hypoxylon sp. FL0890]
MASSDGNDSSEDEFFDAKEYPDPEPSDEPDVSKTGEKKDDPEEINTQKIIEDAMQYRVGLYKQGALLQLHREKLEAMQKRYDNIGKTVHGERVMRVMILKCHLRNLQEKLEGLENLRSQFELENAVYEKTPKPTTNLPAPPTIEMSPQVLEELGLDDLLQLIRSEIMKIFEAKRATTASASADAAAATVSPEPVTTEEYATALEFIELLHTLLDGEIPVSKLAQVPAALDYLAAAEPKDAAHARVRALIRSVRPELMDRIKELFLMTIPDPAQEPIVTFPAREVYQTPAPETAPEITTSEAAAKSANTTETSEAPASSTDGEVPAPVVVPKVDIPVAVPEVSASAATPLEVLASVASSESSVSAQAQKDTTAGATPNAPYPAQSLEELIAQEAAKASSEALASAAQPNAPMTAKERQRQKKSAKRAERRRQQRAEARRGVPKTFKEWKAKKLGMMRINKRLRARRVKRAIMSKKYVDLRCMKVSILRHDRFAVQTDVLSRRDDRVLELMLARLDIKF